MKQLTATLKEKGILGEHSE